jgi:guanylate kinase
MKAKEEIERGVSTYDYLVVNDSLDGCVETVHCIIRAENARRCRIDPSVLFETEREGGH